jgi:hypothetical protein
MHNILITWSECNVTCNTVYQGHLGLFECSNWVETCPTALACPGVATHNDGMDRAKIQSSGLQGPCWWFSSSETKIERQLIVQEPIILHWLCVTNISIIIFESNLENLLENIPRS